VIVGAMTNTVMADEWRQRQAKDALTALGRLRADRQVLLVECHRGHTLGAVYSTDVGPVFLSRPRPSLLDEHELTGVEHHRRNQPGREFVDLLDATWADDDLPAGCYCGNHTLSRIDLEAHLNAGRQLVTLS
jgi:hypothetical protein